MAAPAPVPSPSADPRGSNTVAISGSSHEGATLVKLVVPATLAELERQRASTAAACSRNGAVTLAYGGDSQAAEVRELLLGSSRFASRTGGVVVKGFGLVRRTGMRHSG